MTGVARKTYRRSLSITECLITYWTLLIGIQSIETNMSEELGFVPLCLGLFRKIVTMSIENDVVLYELQDQAGDSDTTHTKTEATLHLLVSCQHRPHHDSRR
jgi:hypothetical protein